VSIKATNWAWLVPGLTTMQRLVLVRLADRSRDGNYRCWPSTEGLAHDCATTRRTVQRTLRQLETMGAIVTSPTPGRANSYVLAVEAMPLGGDTVSPPPATYETRGATYETQRGDTGDQRCDTVSHEALRSFMNHEAEPRMGRPALRAVAHALTTEAPALAAEPQWPVSMVGIKRAGPRAVPEGRCPICADTVRPCTGCASKAAEEDWRGGW
jgi:hypothetical protein